MAYHVTFLEMFLEVNPCFIGCVLYPHSHGSVKNWCKSANVWLVQKHKARFRCSIDSMFQGSPIFSLEFVLKEVEKWNHLILYSGKLLREKTFANW